MSQEKKIALDQLDQWVTSWAMQKPFKTTLDFEREIIVELQFPFRPSVLDNCPTEEAVHTMLDDLENSAAQYHQVQNTGLEVKARGVRKMLVRSEQGPQELAVVVFLYAARAMTDEEHRVNKALRALDFGPEDQLPTGEEFHALLREAVGADEADFVIKQLESAGADAATLDEAKDMKKPSEALRAKEKAGAGPDNVIMLDPNWGRHPAKGGKIEKPKGENEK